LHPNHVEEKRKMAVLAVNQLNNPAVEMTGISKRFRQSRRAKFRPWMRGWKEKVALEEITLEVAAGKITGVLGANGSGKSTLIRILATLLTPDTGSATVFGYDVVADADKVRRHINRVSVEAAFFKEMSPWENMLYAARLYGSGGSGTRARVQEVLHRLGLPRETLDRPMKQLSRGQQQKVAIARSFLTSPSLLLMDEPTTGLDPSSKLEVQSFVSLLRDERAATVLLSTHDLQEAQSLCDQVFILDQGRILAEGTPPELLRRYSAASLEAVFLQLTGKSLEEDQDKEED
jgi:ABC-2 type transport system ATP-binding protein